MFVNETKADLDFYVKATNRMLGNKAKRLMLIVAGVGFAVGLLFLLLELFVFKGEDVGIDYMPAIICLVLAIGMFILYFSLGAITRNSLKKSMNGREVTYRFTFDDDGFQAESNMSDGTAGTTKTAYVNLTAIREYDDMWLVSISQNSFPILKSGMVEGTESELSAFLKEKIGIRYVVMKK